MLLNGFLLDMRIFLLNLFENLSALRFVVELIAAFLVALIDVVKISAEFSDHF